MWPLTAVIYFLCCSGFCCHGCNLTKPYFQSSNFYNVLRWDDVEIPGQGDLYSVQYHIYGEAYEPVTWCQNISDSRCDLTNVTTDVDSRYFAKITASGRCLGEVTFSPLKQTTLEAPQLSVLRNNTSLTVKVTPPMGPHNRPIEMISCWGTCKDLGTQSIKYKVHLTHPKSVAGMVFEGTSDSVVIWLVETDKQYCGDVVYSLTLPFSPRQSEKASFCVNVSARQSWFLIFLLPGLVALVLLIIIPIVLYQQSVRRTCSLPKALMLPRTNTLPLWDNTTWDDISKVQVESGFSDICQKLSQVSFAQERYEDIGYASQDSHDPEWKRDSAGSQQGTAGDGSEPSVSYSMAVGCPDDPSTEDRTDETSFELSGLQSVLVEGTNVPANKEFADSDTNCKPLVVPVITGSSGALQLPEFVFQSSPLLALGERTPLLTDLLIQDSRCNVDYLPVHVSKMSGGLSLSFSGETSNYRENCLPGMSLERQQDQRTYILQTDHPQVSTVPEEENIAVGGLVFLDRWILQMQG
ncbi:uncharacterized protein LOC127657700 [Xyrauchen texanus]|uniref:uncharacterized protein LOC127657700 n=1 Tax=Xyrauchen texanus TaxID=154827 RepID=UPI0022418B81|nr:uncharacterized protein LOC127657700 [Xyrauchen texanus]